MAGSAYLRALLDTIAGTESPGYDVIYGGQRVSDLSDHPRIPVPIRSGPNAGKTSSAAGRYQFLGSTWDEQKQKLGLKDFGPESQDAAAINLAREVFKAKTGYDLDTMLEKGSSNPQVLNSVGKVLSGTWTSLPGGIETQYGKGKDFASKFTAALGKLSPIGSAYADEFPRSGPGTGWQETNPDFDPAAYGFKPVDDDPQYVNGSPGKARPSLQREDIDRADEADMRTAMEAEQNAPEMPENAANFDPAALGFKPVDEATEAPQEKPQEKPQEAQDPSLLHGLRVGLGSVAKGVAGLPMMAYDAAAEVYNQGMAPAAEALGLPPQHRIPLARPALEYAGEVTGLAPAPQDRSERAIDAAGQGIGSVLGGGVLANVMKKGIGGLISGGMTKEALTDLLRIGSTPGGSLYNAASGGASGLAANEVREQGGGAIPQALAGTGTGMAMSVPGAIRNVGRTATAPLTQGGREQIVGTALRESVDDPGAVQARLEVGRPALPNTPVTTAQVAGDAGIWGLEKQMAAKNPSRFGAVTEAKQAGVADYVRKLTKDEAAIEAAKQARDAVALPMLEKAKQAGAVVDVSPVVSRIDEILASGAGKRDTVSNALNAVKAKLFKADGVPETEIDQIYGVRQAVGDLMSGKLKGDMGNAMLAKKELIAINGALDDVIEDALQQAGSDASFKGYLQTYREASKVINRMELGQDLVRKASKTMPSAAGDPVFTSASIAKVEKNPKLMKEIQRTLTPAQRERMARVVDEVRSSTPIDFKRGSDTFENLSREYALSQLLGPEYRSLMEYPARLVMGGVGKLTPEMANPYLWKQGEINRLLEDALLDPKLAAELMKSARGIGPRGMPGRIALPSLGSARER